MDNRYTIELKNMKKLSLLLVSAFALLLFFAGTDVMAQRVNGYNPNSVLPIHTEDIMFEKRVWRRVDLKEKQNLPFFAFNNEITKILIQAVKAGLLPVYVNDDSLRTRMTKEEFLENLKIPDFGGGGLTDEEKAMGFEDDAGDDWGDDAGWGGDEAGGGEEEVVEEEANEFFPNQVSVMEVMEDMIFDRKRSRQYWDIQSLKLILPASNFETGLQREVGTFRFLDCDRLFKSLPESAIWFNPQNSAEHRNLADAFTLRLFSGRIVKVANPRDEFLADIYNKSPRAGIIASQKTEQDLMEMEHNLWEF